MNKVYTAGYQQLKTVERLKQLAGERGATVIDIRFSPRSRQPEWDKAALEKTFGGIAERYSHLPHFGNVNYKGGGPIKLNAPQTGKTLIKYFLIERPVILLCACWNVETCHRKVVAELLQREFGVEVEHLAAPATTVAANEGMKALSLQQPWAWLMVNGYKLIENRKWNTSFRGPVLVHASKTFDEDSVPFVVEMAKKLGIYGKMPYLLKDFQMGGIVGIAEITDCVTSSKSPWFFGQYGFVLKGAKPLPFVPLRGQLGFFDVSAEVVKELGL